MLWLIIGKAKDLERDMIAKIILTFESIQLCYFWSLANCLKGFFVEFLVDSEHLITFS